MATAFLEGLVLTHARTRALLISDHPLPLQMARARAHSVNSPPHVFHPPSPPPPPNSLPPSWTGSLAMSGDPPRICSMRISSQTRSVSCRWPRMLLVHRQQSSPIQGENARKSARKAAQSSKKNQAVKTPKHPQERMPKIMIPWEDRSRLCTRELWCSGALRLSDDDDDDDDGPCADNHQRNRNGSTDFSTNGTFTGASSGSACGHSTVKSFPVSCTPSRLNRPRRPLRLTPHNRSWPCELSQ